MTTAAGFQHLTEVPIVRVPQPYRCPGGIEHPFRLSVTVPVPDCGAAVYMLEWLSPSSTAWDCGRGEPCPGSRSVALMADTGARYRFRLVSFAVDHRTTPADLVPLLSCDDPELRLAAFAALAQFAVAA